MSDTIAITAIGVSPMFTVTAEEFSLDLFTTLTRIDIDGVQPPLLGADGGASALMDIRNLWFPWVDEKLIEPKYDGVGLMLGVPSNQPSFIRDYHMLSLFRAADALLATRYDAMFLATVTTPYPIGPPPSPSDQF